MQALWPPDECTIRLTYDNSLRDVRRVLAPFGFACFDIRTQHKSRQHFFLVGTQTRWLDSMKLRYGGKLSCERKACVSHLMTVIIRVGSAIIIIVIVIVANC